VVLCDLTYVRINQWHYLCVLLDLCRRKVLGYSVGREKNECLVIRAIHSVRIDLRRIYIFHTDRGAEFIGERIATILRAMGIEHSLSAKGSPCDNSPMEAFYKSFKAEFMSNRKYTRLSDFLSDLSDWMDWYNHIRLHSSLDHQPPVVPILEVKNGTEQ